MSFPPTVAAKIFTLPELVRRRRVWSIAADRVVFTNGVFDLVHPGHLTYLAEARALGQRLIVGLNADASVRRLKGPERPIMDERARAMLLASLFYVDAVVLFTEDTPLNLIVSLRPDVLVKGGDYRIADIVGTNEVAKYGGETRVLPFVTGFSSTDIINKIRG